MSFQCSILFLHLNYSWDPERTRKCMLTLFLLFFLYTYRTSSCHSQTFHRLLKTKKQEEAWHALYDESTSHQNPGCIKIKLSGALDMKNLDTKFSLQASYDCSKIIQSFCKIIIRRRTTKTKLCWHITIVRVQLWQEWVTNIQKQKRNLMIEVFNSFIETW